MQTSSPGSLTQHKPSDVWLPPSEGRASARFLVNSCVNCLLAFLPADLRRKTMGRIERCLRTLGSYLLPHDPDDFVIRSLPRVIRQPGRYRLAADLVYSEANGAAITIDANHVTLDFMGHALRNTAGPGTCATGIGGADVKDVKLVGGTVSGFRYGVLLRDGKRYRVENMRVEENWQWGISVEGTDCVVRDNAIISTGGSTASCSNACIALRAFGARQSIVGNVISGVRRSPRNAEWVGIHFDRAPDSRLEYNTITAAAPEPRTWGIWLNGGTWSRAGGTNVLVKRNVFVNLHTAGAFVDRAGGTCADNLLVNITDSFIVGGPEVHMRDDGGNMRFLRVKVQDNKSRHEPSSEFGQAQPLDRGPGRG